MKQLALYITIISGIFVLQVNCYTKVRPKTECNANEPLILTPLIRDGKIHTAQTAAEVKLKDFQNVKSYAGYLTVNELFNSNLFFWFFPSQTDYANAPVILWLEGGPGATSMMGIFYEIGPVDIRPKEGLKMREHSWSRNHSVIYIDNPVGTGYSFTNDGGYTQNETVIGDHLYEGLLQFFQLFPELQRNDFFIVGASYAGKFVPAVAYSIHKNIPGAAQKINLKGLSIGNGYCDPEHQSQYADYLYQIGLIDNNGRNSMKELEEQGKQYIRDKQWLKALTLFSNLLGASFNTPTLFRNLTGFESLFNFLIPKENFDWFVNMNEYVQRDYVRSAIHVGNNTFLALSSTVEQNLQEDIMQSVAPWVSELLSHYRVLLYSGQLDINVAYHTTISFLNHLNFSAAEEYKIAERHQWYVGSDLAGYAKQAGNLTEVLVRNAGHLVTNDQPLWALELISKFTRNERLW